jgi:hypothetical protein
MASCIDVQMTCQGISISCLDGAACGAGLSCCISLADTSASCKTPVACVASAGAILCRASTDCPALLPNCCRIAGAGICRAQTCP